MSKYIDADKLKLKVNHEMDMQDTYLPAHFFDIVDDMPAADVAEVRRGLWIYIQDEEGGNGLYECSECNRFNMHSKSLKVPYCWNCGAKMKERGKNEP